MAHPLGFIEGEAQLLSEKHEERRTAEGEKQGEPQGQSGTEGDVFFLFLCLETGNFGHEERGERGQDGIGKENDRQGHAVHDSVGP